MPICTTVALFPLTGAMVYNMKNYYIKSYDSILTWQWYTDINTCHLYRHLIQTVNRTEAKFRGEVVKKGETAVSLRTLSENTGLSVQQIRTSINKLISTQDVTRVERGKLSLISIPKFDKWQSSNTEANTASTREQHASNTQSTHILEGKKEEGKKKKEIKEEGSLFALPKDRNGFEVPEWLPLEEWNAYLEMRVGKQKKATDRAKAIAIGKLQKYLKAGHDIASVLDNSTLNSWVDLYEPKENRNGNKYKNDTSGQGTGNRYADAHNAYAAKLAARTQGET